MKYQGKITDPKDLVTKEYVDTGLSGKQNTLTFDDVPTAGSSNPVKSSGIKSALDTFVRPNLLDNAYFVGGGSQQGIGKLPINQRGQTSYSGKIYGIDRWKNTGSGTVAISSSGIVVSGASSGGSYFVQQILNPVPDGTVCTFSALSSDGTLYKATSAMSSASQWNCSFNHANGSGRVEYSTHAVLTAAAGKTATWVAAKLEIGDTQTLCHNEGTEANPVWVLNEIPDYNTEFRKCQVYQPFIGRTDRNYSPVAVGIVDTTTSARLFINLPASPMKAPKNPITFLGTLTLRQYYNGSLSYHPISAVYTDSWSESLITAYAKTTGLTVGAFCDVFLESGSLQIDCNL